MMRVPSRYLAEVVRQGGAWRARELFGKGAPVALSGAGGIGEGDIVALRRHGAQAKLDERVAVSGGALAAMYRLAASHSLDPVFPRAVEREVESWRANPGIDDAALTDLRAIPFVSVDGPGTRDLDQALHVAREGRGFVVDYAVADAAHYVRPGSALFDEALRRGASYYLPGLSIPMLPRALSEGLVSLNAGVPRRALVFRVHLRADGTVDRTEVIRARIESRAQLSFDDVDAYLVSGELDRVPREAATALSLLHEVGLLRLREAEQRDVVRYLRHEGELGIDPSGMHFVVASRSRGLSEVDNEQLSILCNIEAARMLLEGERDDQVQPIYRVHPRPDAERLAELEALLEALCEHKGLDRSRWGWRRGSGRSLAEYLAALPTAGEQGRLARAIHRQAVLCNVRSTFSDEPDRHHGIGAEVYARFSAPMRELVGVFVHKELLEKRRITEARPHAEDDRLRALVVKRAGEARALQKRITKEVTLLALDQLFESDRALAPGSRPLRRGTVMGLDARKVHVLLDDPGIEVKVYLAPLAKRGQSQLLPSDDGVEVRREDGAVLCRLGDAVGLRVLDRDRRGRWTLGLE